MLIGLAQDIEWLAAAYHIRSDELIWELLNEIKLQFWDEERETVVIDGAGALSEFESLEDLFLYLSVYSRFDSAEKSSLYFGRLAQRLEKIECARIEQSSLKAGQRKHE